MSKMCLMSCKQYAWLFCASTHYAENSCPPGHKGLADGAQRRVSLGSSSATSIYPLPEAPENKEQLGCQSVFLAKPLLTVHNTYVASIKPQNFLDGKEPSAKSRKEFARTIGFRLTGDCNPTGIDATEFYPPNDAQSFQLSIMCLSLYRSCRKLCPEKEKYMA